MKRIKVLLADDHAILAEGLVSLLKDNFILVGVAANGRELVDYARQYQPDIIISDISMPLLNGIAALEFIKKEGLRSKVIILTMHEDAILAINSFKAGASGYLIKRSACTELIEAINEVMAGRIYLSPSIELGHETMLQLCRNASMADSFTLSPRQKEILQLTAEGKTMKEIASLLNISPRTVESHKYALMQTLGLKTTADLITYAIRSRVGQE